MPRASVSPPSARRWKPIWCAVAESKTRRVPLTDDGALHCEYCARILSEVSDAESALSSKRQTPRETIKVDTSTTFAGTVLIPARGEFNAQYPDITVKLGLADRNIHLIQDGSDCVVRIGVLDDSSLLAQSLGKVKMTTCAAPSYLVRVGTPNTSDDPEHHKAVNYFSTRSGRIYPFEFELDGTVVERFVDGILAVNDGRAYVTAATEGLGLIQIPRFMVAKAIDSGVLLEVLRDYPCPPVPLSRLYPHSRVSTRVRVFSEWVSELARHNPDLI
jgi:LysR family transcriptional regulator for bpeEF and oprC